MANGMYALFQQRNELQSRVSKLEGGFIRRDGALHRFYRLVLPLNMRQRLRLSDRLARLKRS